MAKVKVIEISSKSGGLKDEISDFKRRRISEEACHLFYLHGYEGATIDAIAGRLDVTKPFIYSYFKNKSELLFEICQTGIELSMKAIDEVVSMQRAPTERLRLLVDRVVRIVIDYQEYIVVYEREEKNLDPELARSIRKKRNEFDHRLAELLEEGKRAGEFEIPDPVMTATTISGMMSWVSFWYSPQGKWSEAEIITHVMSMIEAVVLGREQRSGKSSGNRDGGPT